ncbi:MAG TPA: YbdD/YjiX family protein [Candidatus Acidoferrales bacterium]|nr:YbdD/YjiX family protein [Candidatus Acidoferrales bacterium]
MRRTAWMHVRSALTKTWWWLRQTSGDAAYEIYLRGEARHHFHSSNWSGSPVLSRKEFYLDALRRKYSRVSRCC